MSALVARAFLAIAIAGGAALRGQDQTAEDTRARLQSIVAGGEYQTELPGRGERSDGVSRERRPGQQVPEERREDRTPFPANDSAGNAAATILVALIGACCIALLAVLAVRDRGRDTDVTVAVTRPREPRPEPSHIDPGGEPLAAAERLAREGRFTDAIRALLVATLDALRARGGFHAPPWMTGREIARQAPLPAASSSALRSLVAAVEHGLFAGFPATRPDYERCAEAFRALRAVPGGGST